MVKILGTLRLWLRAWQQPASYFGLAMIIAIWASFTFHLATERNRLEFGSIKNSSNLARVFEEHIVRTLKETDRTLLLVRTAYLADPSGFSLEKMLESPALKTNLNSRISIIRVDGAVTMSGPGPFSSINASDRAYFRFQRDSTSDELFIGEPVIGRIVGRQVIQLSRALRAADGSFQGVILATIDTDYLANFYTSVDVGKHGAIVLVGLDGIIRASAGFKGDTVGNSLKNSRLFSKIKVSDVGSFLTAGNQDSVKRFVSYRQVKGYPLIVYVGESRDEVLAPYARNQKWYFGIASIATIIITVVVIFAIRSRRRLDAAQDALQASEARARLKSRELEVTLEHMDQGIVMIDANRDVAVVNRRLVELLGLPQKLIARFRRGEKIKVDEALSLLWSTGEYGKDGAAVDPKIREMILSGGMSAEIPVYERTRPDGTTLEVRATALSDGGIVRTFTDVSERKRKELQIDFMARHDSLTGLANRALMNERLEQAFSRLRRHQEGFALLYLDLDRFKAVNDARGHAVGDALLRNVATRLSDCIRETDTVARLGGDEFVILLAATESKNDAEMLAKRVVKSLAAPYDIDGSSALIGTSIGIAMASADGSTPEVLLKNADIALYRAKACGGNAYRFFGQAKTKNVAREKLLSAV